MTWPIVQISERAKGQIEKGSLWIFSNEFVSKIKGIKSGTWIDFHCRGQFVAYGYVNPHSLITGRVCSRTPVLDRKGLFLSLIERSLNRRKDFFEFGSYRAVFAESDWLSGLIVDVYENSKGTVLVAQSNTAGMDEARSDWQDALVKIFKPSGLVVKADSAIRRLEEIKNFTEVILGNEQELSQGQVLEDGVSFAADFVNGQKTGFFLDQRDNRLFLKKKSKSLKILDLCSYSGGWGISALSGGAQHVTFVDQSEEALALVTKGLALNDFSLERASLIKSDVFDFLEKNAEKFDVVVADPPAFIKSKKNMNQGLKAYAKLNSLALSKLAPGGVLYTCSCSFHLSESEFEKILIDEVQKARRECRVLFRGTQAGDHPWILNRPESKYLKCLGFKVE